MQTFQTSLTKAHLRPTVVPMIHHPYVCGHVGPDCTSAADVGSTSVSGCLLSTPQKLGSRRHGLDNHGWLALLSLQVCRLQIKGEECLNISIL